MRRVVGVDGSVDELFQKGLNLGGTEALPLADMKGIGRVGYLLDPDGNVFGLCLVVAPSTPLGCRRAG